MQIAHGSSPRFYEFTGRLDRARELLAALREQIAARGEESALPFVLVHVAVTAWLAGDFETTEREASEALRVAALQTSGPKEAWTFSRRKPSGEVATRGNSRGLQAFPKSRRGDSNPGPLHYE